MELSINSIITSVMHNFEEELSIEQYQRLKTALEIELKDCSIEKKSYELANVNMNDRLVKEYLVYLKTAGRSDRTIKQYHQAIQNMLFDINKDILDIDKRDLKVYFARYMMVHEVKESTVVNIHRFISPFFKFLVEEEYINKNPMSYVKPPKAKDPDIKPFSPSDIEEMRQYIDHNSNIKNRAKTRAIFEFLLATGCRVGEIVNIRLSDIDFAEKSVIVTGKGNKTRTVYYNGIASKYLKDYLTTRKDDVDYLFISKLGDNITVGGIEEMCKNLCGDNIHSNPHRFRHTFAQICIDRGMAIQDLSQLMGHDEIGTTMRYYRHNKSKAKAEYNKYVS